VADAPAPDRTDLDGAADATGSDAPVEDATTVDSAPPDVGDGDAQAADIQLPDATGSDGASADVGAAADASPGDGAAGDAGTAVACGTVAAMVDDFAGNALSWLWWQSTDPGTACTVAQSALQCTLASASQGGYANVGTNHFLSLRDASMQVKVVATLGATTDHEASFEFIASARNYLALTTYDDMFVGSLVLDGSRTSQHMAYDPELTHWRLREAGGTLHAGVSADGTLWQEFFSHPAPAWIDRGIIALGLGSWGNSTTAASAQFDSLNLGSTTPYCAASTLHDAFARGSLGPEWAIDERPGCTVAVDGTGALTFTRAASLGSGSCTITSTRLYDVTDSAVEVDLVRAPSVASSGWVGVALYADDFWVELAGNAEGVYSWVDVTDESLTYSGSPAGRRLRLSRDATGFGFALLNDAGAVWSARSAVPQSLSTQAYVVLFLFVRTDSGAVATGSLDDVN
jgi:hypothetical protein